jgi:hypothetical protein
VETLDVAVTGVAAAPSRTRDQGAKAIAPSHEPAVGRWPGWTRLAILLGGSAALWAGLAWVAVLVLKLH